MSLGQLLYHYSSTQTGFAILQSRTIRLSALSAANDSIEGRVMGRTFSQLLEGTGLPKGVVDVASILVEGYADSTEGFALCLSERGDLLSQWRAYADDGTGIAIGFSPEVLRRDFGPVNFGKAFFELVKIDYGDTTLRKSLAPIAEQVRIKFQGFGEFIGLKEGISRSDALRMLADRKCNISGLFQGKHPESKRLLSELLEYLAPLHFQIYNTKAHTFHEECEWRLLRYRHRTALPEIRYFSDAFSVKPFIPCLLADPALDAIQEVIMGPKHRSNINWMRAFLTTVGFGNVRVRSSEHVGYR